MGGGEDGSEKMGLLLVVFPPLGTGTFNLRGGGDGAKNYCNREKFISRRFS